MVVIEVMLKDYQPANELQGVSEDEYVESYWTKVWEKNKRIVDGDAATIDALAGELGEWVTKRAEYPIVRKYLGDLPANARILDGGSGVGKWVLYLISQGFSAAGLDISRSTVERLNARFAGNHFMHGDIRSMDIPSSCLDAYMSWGTFEHFEDGLGRCFKEAHRVLRPGGLLFVSVPFQNTRLLWRSTRKLPSDRSMRFHQYRLTKAELQFEFEIGGFEVCEVAEIHKKFGLHRAIFEEAGLPNNSRAHKLLYNLSYGIVPSGWVSHMILGVGRKA